MHGYFYFQTTPFVLLVRICVLLLVSNRLLLGQFWWFSEILGKSRNPSWRIKDDCSLENIT